MIALLVSVISFISLWFAYIDHLVGGAIAGYDPYTSGMRFAIASLIVIFPAYIALTRMLNQDIRKTPEKKQLWVRRWVVVLAIFVAGVSVLIDLIVLLNTFLGGEELTSAFLLKVLAVLIVAGGVFAYYVADIRGRWEKKESESKIIGAIIVVVVIASVIAGFFILGTPQTQRMLRYDNQRINDLQSVQYMVLDFYRSKEVLPENIDALRDPLEGRYIPEDPTGVPYVYTKTGALTFELCATFELPQPEAGERADRTDYRVQELNRQREEWPYEPGQTCFERTVDPDTVTFEKTGLPVPIR